MMKLSTATQYGLLELRSKEGYKPTDKFTSVYKPLSEEEKKKSEIECLLNPELYIKLVEKNTRPTIASSRWFSHTLI